MLGVNNAVARASSSYTGLCGSPNRDQAKSKTFFSEEKKQKTFTSLSRFSPATYARTQKSFGSFLQKRTASFKTQTYPRRALLAAHPSVPPATRHPPLRNLMSRVASRLHLVERPALPKQSLIDGTASRHTGTAAFGLGILLAGAAALLPCTAAAADLPPLNAPASSEHHVGKRIYAELVTPDLAAAKQFYAQLFCWTFQDDQKGDAMFTQASLDGQVIGGIYQRPLPAGRRPGWISFIATTDLAKTAALATQNGAKLLLSPRPFVNLGQEAVLSDPQGAVFAVLQSNSGDPADYLVSPGDWIWSSLIATDPKADADFYKTVFGYDVYAMPEAQDSQHLLLASDNFARASVNPIPPAWTNAKPRWLNFIRVDSAAATSAKVTALGGKIIQQPHTDRHGGKIAVVADPAGALFGLMEWPDDSPAGNAK